MIEERKNKLRKELKYLITSEIEKEINNNQDKLNNQNIKIKDIAKEIYIKRGINYNKLNINYLDSIEDVTKIYQNSSKEIKRKMILDIIYIFLILLLIKIPFNLVRDIGYDYIEVLSKNNLYYNLWNLLFLALYTVTFISSLLLFIRNFKTKYNK